MRKPNKEELAFMQKRLDDYQKIGIALNVYIDESGRYAMKSYEIPDPPVAITDQSIEKLIDGVKIIPIGILYDHLVIINDFSKAVHIQGMSIDDIKSEYGHFKSAKALFDHLDSLVIKETPKSGND